MKKERLEKIQSIGDKIGQKEKPPVTEKNLLFVAGYFHTHGFNIHVSDGLLTKDHFITPCIPLFPKKQPKIQYNNQKEFFDTFVKNLGKKNLKQLTGKEYAKLYTAAAQLGETDEYVAWRNVSAPVIQEAKDLIEKYNKTRKGLTKSEQLAVLIFEDGVARLDFGNQTNQNMVRKVQKLPMMEKRKKMKQFLNEFKLLKEYIINNTY